MEFPNTQDAGIPGTPTQQSLNALTKEWHARIVIERIRCKLN